jgi:hypothetical protein
MTDIVAIETAKAREQAERLMPHCIGVDSDEHAAELIVTALLEAKADVLAELDANLTDEEIAELFNTPIAALRQEVWNRRARGL